MRMALLAGYLVAGCCYASLLVAQPLSIQTPSPASSGARAHATERAHVSSCREMSAEEKTNLGIVRQVLNEKKPYAALAFIEAFTVDLPQLDLLRAQSLQQIGDYAAAEAIYSELTGTCMAGYGYQGLGQISDNHGQHQLSADYLAQAVRLLPIDSAIRGDYGFALMQMQDYQGAYRQYVTAIELDGGNERARNNLLHLLYLTNEPDKAEQLARKMDVSSDALEQIHQQVLMQGAGS